PLSLHDPLPISQCVCAPPRCPEMWPSVLSLERCLRGCQPGNGNPERAATYVVQTEPVTKFDAGRFAAVFAANSELDVWSRLSSQVAGNFHQAADALLINRGKRI